MLDSLDANQKNTIRDLIRGTSVRGMEACYLPSQAVPSF
jgi:hypothetical protein